MKVVCRQVAFGKLEISLYLFECGRQTNISRYAERGGGPGQFLNTDIVSIFTTRNETKKMKIKKLSISN